MGSGFGWEPPTVPLGRSGIVLSVFRLDADDAGEPGTLTPLPNVLCTDVEFSEGAEPGAARFRYSFNPVFMPEAPSRIEHIYPLDSTGPYVVRPDDRIVVYYPTARGGTKLLFDGFVQLPQANIDSRAESGTFTALGTPTREWDTALRGAVLRDMDDILQGESVQTDEPARFNPDGHPNATPEEGDASFEIDGQEFEYPTFVGDIYPMKKVNDQTPRHWTVGMALRYILARGLTRNGAGLQTWVKVLDWGMIDDGMRAIVPREGGGAVNWPDPSTFELEDIVVQDLDITGEYWPAAAQKLLEPHGFTLLFRLRTDDEGMPLWWVEVFRKDINVPLKSLFLQEPGSVIDPGLNNLWRLQLARDSKAIKNRIVVDGAPTKIEASYVLSALFTPDPADLGFATKKDYLDDQKNAATDKHRKYREWGVDEAGEGHYDEDSSMFVTGERGELDPVLNPPPPAPVEGESVPDPPPADERPYAFRRRKPQAKLLTLGKDRNPLEAELFVSTDYEGTMGAPWDGTGTWQKVPGSAWNLLPDRIGIRFTVDDILSIKLSDPAEGETGKKGQKINLMESLANPTDAAGANPLLYFRLTCVIEDDRGIFAVAERRGASPIKFEIERRIDARDRFAKTVVSRHSHHAENPGWDGEERIVRDDTKKAKTYAEAQRRAHERATFSGTASLPRFTDAYEIGDKLDRVVGRGISLRTNAATEQGESETYPVVVALRYSFEAESEETQLTLNDHRAEPARRRQR